MIEQAIQMLERMIARHKKALEVLRAGNAKASKIRYAERAIGNYKEQLKRLKEQAGEIGKDGGGVISG